MHRLFKKKMPMPVNLNDCVLLWQMGYSIQINDGRVVEIRKEKGEKEMNVFKIQKDRGGGAGNADGD